MQKRKSLELLLKTLILPFTLPLFTSTSKAAQAAEDIERLQNNWRDLAPDGFSAPASDDRIELSESEWQRRLDRSQFRVMREAGTERPHSSPLNANEKAGLYVCAGCDLPLFSSAMKYESGTGWPSFFTRIPGALETRLDLKMLLPRTEYHCVRCGSHQGHVFDDGPPPTGKRWCNNGVALKFLDASVTMSE